MTPPLVYDSSLAVSLSIAQLDAEKSYGIILHPYVTNLDNAVM